MTRKLSPYAKMQRAALRRSGVKPTPSPKFKIGQYVEDIEAHHGNTLPGRVMFIGAYDDLIGGYRYKVQTQDGHVLYHNEPSLQRIRKPAWAGRVNRSNPTRAYPTSGPQIGATVRERLHKSYPDKYLIGKVIEVGGQLGDEYRVRFVVPVHPAYDVLRERYTAGVWRRATEGSSKAAGRKQNPKATPRVSYVAVYRRPDGQEVVEGWSLKKKGRPTVQALARYVAELESLGEDVVSARIMRRDLPTDGMHWHQAAVHGTTVAGWPSGHRVNPTPAIRAFKKAMGHNYSTRDLASEAIGAYGWKTSLPGFPRWLGDPVPEHNRWTASKMIQLADWIDEHAGRSAHPYRDALRIEAATLRQNPHDLSGAWRASITGAGRSAWRHDVAGGGHVVVREVARGEYAITRYGADGRGFDYPDRYSALANAQHDALKRVSASRGLVPDVRSNTGRRTRPVPRRSHK